MNIKKRIFKAYILLLNEIMEAVYFLLKLLPVREGKILFCSRQSKKVPLDFILLKAEINAKSPSSKIVIICSHIDQDVRSKVIFFAQMLESMYHLATSEVCIIDSYWPAVSMLHHKKNLKIIQLWHSLGKTKKSGYQTLGKKSGRRREFAKYLKMHKNYDYLIGGAPVWNKYYCEAFNIAEDKILNYGLPRIDYLVKTEKQNREKFFESFPQWKGKKIVLYAPTFRRNMKSEWNKIGEAQKYEDIVIVIKNHPGQSAGSISAHENIAFIDDWETIDLLAACDYMITDYSSIALEAAVLRKKTFYWTYDYDEYMKNSGINIDLRKELSDNVFEDIDQLLEHIRNDKYNSNLQQRYINKYLPSELGNSTERITSLILSLITEQQVEIYETGDNGRWQREQMEKSFGNYQTLGGDKWRTADLKDNKAVGYDGSGEFGDNSNVS